MASLPYPRCPPNSFHRTHSKFVCASPPTEFTEFTEASGGGYSPTDFTEYTEASGGEEPPTDFTDVHRFLFPTSCFCVFREFCGKIVLWLRGYGRDAIPSYFCENLCNLWENILRQKFFAFCGRIVMLVHDCFVGAAGTAAPPCRVQKVH